MPLATSSQRVNIWYHTGPHDQWKRVRGWHGQFIFPRPRAVSRSETRIDQLHAFNFSIIFRIFPSGSETKNLRRILHDPVGRTPRHVCRIFRAKNRRSDLSVFNIKQNLAKVLDPRLKSSHLKEITYRTHFYAQKSECPRRFER